MRVSIFNGNFKDHDWRIHLPRGVFPAPMLASYRALARMKLPLNIVWI